jgi:putative flippase GtrA
VIADYALGICYGYLLNRHWTFRAHGRPRYGLLKYCTSYALVFGLNVALLVPFVELLGWREDLAQIPAIGIATIASYAAQRFWVFQSAK